VLRLVVGGVLGIFLHTGTSTSAIVFIRNSVVGTVAGVVMTPFLAATIAIMYFDLRVRKEGLDLELVAQRLGGGGALPPGPPSGPPPAPPPRPRPTRPGPYATDPPGAPGPALTDRPRPRRPGFDPEAEAEPDAEPFRGRARPVRRPSIPEPE